MTNDAASRRPLKTRQAAWAVRLASVLVRAGANPNGISLFSILFGALSGVALVLSGRSDGTARVIALVAAALCIQLRLLCNMLDGMVAVEGNRRSKVGEVYNDAPDRLSDVFTIVGAGYALTWLPWGRELGWAAALLAVLTAYVRMLGGASGLVQDFSGPMAKPHRMATLTAGCLLSTFDGFLPFGPGRILFAALLVVTFGSAVTTWRRLVHVVRGLEAR